MIISPNGKSDFIEPLSSPDNVQENIQILVNQIKSSDKNVIEKASLLAQEIWLNQPFIDGNKRTARLLMNFMTMIEGFPLFTYENKGSFFNQMLISQYKEGKSGIVENLIIELLETRIKQLLD